MHSYVTNSSWLEWAWSPLWLDMFFDILHHYDIGDCTLLNNNNDNVINVKKKSTQHVTKL